MWRLVLGGGLHLSPIDSHPQKILDVGTGSGIWAMQTADAYPSAEVIAFDISPVQPSWVPPNLHFEIDDLEKEWLWKHDSFDFVHCRFMFMSVRDWPTMLHQAYHTLKPGGYIELSELDLNPKPAYDGMPDPKIINKWFAVKGEIMKRQGIDMRIASKYKQLLIDAGFECVVEEVRTVPWGQWPEDEKLKRIGYWHLGMSFPPALPIYLRTPLTSARTIEERTPRHHCRLSFSRGLDACRAGCVYRKVEA